MTDHQYSYRELELLFKRIDEKLDDIRLSIKANLDSNEKRFTQIEHEIAPTTNIKTVNNLAYASVKTVNGLAIASVKDINGLA